MGAQGGGGTVRGAAGRLRRGAS